MGDLRGVPGWVLFGRPQALGGWGMLASSSRYFYVYLVLCGETHQCQHEWGMQFILGWSKKGNAVLMLLQQLLILLMLLLLSQQWQLPPLQHVLFKCIAHTISLAHHTCLTSSAPAHIRTRHPFQVPACRYNNRQFTNAHCLHWPKRGPDPSLQSTRAGRSRLAIHSDWPLQSSRSREAARA